MSKLTRCLYLQRNKQFIYYYRRAVPLELRSTFNGKTEIKRSLKTREIQVAMVRYGILAAQVELTLHDMKRTTMANDMIDPSTLIAIKKDAVAVSKEGTHAIWSGIVQALRGQTLKFDSGRAVEDVPITVQGDKLFRLDGSQVDALTIATALAYADSVGIPKMINEDIFKDGDIQCTVSWHESAEEQQEKRLQELGLTDEFIEVVASLKGGIEPITSEVARQEALPKAKKKSSISFSQLYENYFVHRSNVKSTTNDESRKQFELFIDVNGDIDVSEIDHVMITNYVNTLRFKIPANVRKIFKHETILEIMKKEKEHKRLNRKMMSVANINKYISQLSGLFNYAVNHGYMEQNYATGKRLKDSVHGRDKREPFTEDEIVKIFTQVEPWASNNRKKPEIFWINLIGLYSGARLGEICQLRTSDVREVTESNCSCWVFEVNDEGFDKSVKTRNSTRLVPIHSKLIELGFLDYVKERRQSGAGQLWDLEPHPTKGWSHTMSKRICYVHKQKANINKPFHCWRHTVCDLLMKNDDVRKEEQEAFVGHAIGGESMGRYGKGLSLSILKHTVECIQYDFLDLHHLKSEN